MDTQGSEQILISSSKNLNLAAVENFEMKQKELSIITTDNVTLEQKQLEIKATDSITINIGASTVKIDNHGSADITIGAVKININGMSGSVNITGTTNTTFTAALNADAVFSGGRAL